AYLTAQHPERGLPIADAAKVNRFLGRMIGERRGQVAALVLLNVLSAGAGLAVPLLLGRLIDQVTTRGSAFADQLGTMMGLIAALVVAQAVIGFAALRVSTVFGQGLLAAAREYVIRSVLRLPLSQVESSSTGDLVTRVTRDVSMMAMSVRWALPTFILQGITVLATVVMMLVVSVPLTAPFLVCALGFAFVAARYIRLVGRGYLAEGVAYSRINTNLTETIEGARTVEALGLQRSRIETTDDDIEIAAQTERYTLYRRMELFAASGFAYNLPLVLILLMGGYGYSRGWASLGQITAITLYLQQVTGPLARLVQTLNMMQEGVASTARLIGIDSVPRDRQATGEQPDGQQLAGRDLRFAYRPGRDVLHGVDLELRPGERVAVVGPSGSGKSTLGRLLAGINAPRTGVVEVGGVDVMNLPLARLRTDVALVTQEHHVFVGTIRDNIVLAREDDATDASVWRALGMVQAAEWVERLPEGLNTRVGSGNTPLTPAQAQQIALARLVIADPHTLVLDEATSLIDPHTARDVEGSMSALLDGRTVVAIAHRLHTAHDADRIAVVIDGRITELGSHDELIRRDGEYAALWRGWTS
ncbi:MAG: ABC transporter ATP-binding protein, partial [Brooklawnia sp.]